MARPSPALLKHYQYIAGPSKYGRYPVLPSSSALKSYPKPLPVPKEIPRPSYVPRNFFTAGWGEHEAVEHDTEPEGDRIPLAGSEGGEEVDNVREVGRMAAEILGEVGKMVKPGVTTSKLDQAVHEMIIARGAYPSPLGYSSFPRSCTTSVNNVIAHGIPDDRPLHPEDIINIDLTLYYQGYHGDNSATFLLPDVDQPGRELVEATQEALDVGIRACGIGKRYKDIGAEIEDFARRHGFSVNAQFSGHGIGKRFHQPPWIFHVRNDESGEMRPGDCFTIEPCLVQGRNSRGVLWDDGWTMATESGARSAQFEHQILITEDGVEILSSK
ncbi:methionine aminopeptidase, type I [Kwoniella heveanensis BCC8398]|uniref:Methionine aminopeptidase n=1 Tax=Kwoniella heveanensis BCC8398 TaxID=1296120 RepID=A0A1B9H0K3_9TREE|nr:methionine aminopeptidase, type I [Kwoniella heveanensis BCC8398]